MKVVGMNTTNQKTKKGGSCAEKYTGGRSVKVPGRESGGFSKGTVQNVNKREAVPGNAHQGLSESGTEAD